jgi:hypothetical protein
MKTKNQLQDEIHEEQCHMNYVLQTIGNIYVTKKTTEDFEERAKEYVSDFNRTDSRINELLKNLNEMN